MIICLHGFTGAPESFGALRSALPAPSHALALLGHGAPAPSVVSFQGEVDRLAAAIGELPGSPGHWVVGYSLGGRLALGLACRHPEVLAGVIAVGAHPGLTDPLLREERRGGDEARARELLDGGVAAFVDRWQELPLFASQRSLAPAVLADQRRVRLSHSAPGLARSLRILGLGAMPDLRPALDETTVPVHLVTGALDAKFTAIGAGLSRAASHIVVAGAGHNVLLERPDALARVIGSIVSDARDARDARDALDGRGPRVEVRP